MSRRRTSVDEPAREIGVMGYSQPDERTLHDSYADAGTTWWLESLHDRRATWTTLLARVDAGPRPPGRRVP